MASRPNIPSRFIQPEDVLDRIHKAWLAGKLDDLSDGDRKILERIEYADAKLTKGGKGSLYRNLLKDMVQKFSESHGVCSRTLENDIKRAKMYFEPVRSRESKEYGRGKSIQWLERFLWKAEEAGDFRAIALLMKEYNDIQGFKKEDPNLPDYNNSVRQPMLIINEAINIGVPEIPNLDYELDQLRKPKSDYLNNLDAEDIDFEEESD